MYPEMSGLEGPPFKAWIIGPRRMSLRMDEPDEYGEGQEAFYSVWTHGRCCLMLSALRQQFLLEWSGIIMKKQAQDAMQGSWLQFFFKLTIVLN